MRTNIYIFFALLGGVLWSACGQSRGDAEAYGRDVVSEEVTAKSVSTSTADETTDLTASASYERKLTKRGTIRFETSDAKKTHAAIQQAVVETKGYISSESTKIGRASCRERV